MTGATLINTPAPAYLDLHVHSTCSEDGASGIGDYAHRAQALGLSEVGFCEHVDLDPRDRGCGYLDLARYDAEIATARAAVPDVPLRKGMEITYQTGLEEKARTWLAGHAWDYVVVSVHLVDYADGWAIISEPETARAYFAGHSQRQAYVPYFEELLRAAGSGLGDLLGHLDLIKRYGTTHYGPFQPTDFRDEIRAVLCAAIEGGVGLEINTSGWRQSPGEPYPTRTVLRWYRELGGEILSIGSDAHHTGDLGEGVAQALDLAREVGFRAIASFEKRKIHWIDL
jgi:histidinol-phosphatase (PHP family)